jgi:hypothetical protein
VTSGPTLYLTNTDGKPAARFDAVGTSSPFVVNNTKKVQNLNADELDGIDSNGFARVVSAHVTTPINPNFPEVTILTVPGFGTLTAQCPNFGGVYVGFHHTTTHWMAVEKHDGTNPVVIDSTGTFTQLMAGSGGGDHWTLAIDQGSGPSAAMATLDFYTNYGASGCTLQAQAILSQGS